MADETDTGAQALEQGYLGSVPDTIENEAYAVDADHADTAQRVLDQREQLRSERIKASRHSDDDTSTPAKSASKSSSSSAGSSSSSKTSTSSSSS